MLLIFRIKKGLLQKETGLEVVMAKKAQAFFAAVFNIAAAITTNRTAE